MAYKPAHGTISNLCHMKYSKYRAGISNTGDKKENTLRRVEVIMKLENLAMVKVKFQITFKLLIRSVTYIQTTR